MYRLKFRQPVWKVDDRLWMRYATYCPPQVFININFNIIIVQYRSSAKKFTGYMYRLDSVSCIDRCPGPVDVNLHLIRTLERILTASMCTGAIWATASIVCTINELYTFHRVVKYFIQWVYEYKQMQQVFLILY